MLSGGSLRIETFEGSRPRCGGRGGLWVLNRLWSSRRRRMVKILETVESVEPAMMDSLPTKINEWARLLAYVTGLVTQQMLLRNEYLAAENRILRA
jgi:hypothetical protein